jgi:hypothetical protein
MAEPFRSPEPCGCASTSEIDANTEVHLLQRECVARVCPKRTVSGSKMDVIFCMLTLREYEALNMCYVLKKKI